MTSSTLRRSSVLESITTILPLARISQSNDDFHTLADSGKEFPWVGFAFFLGRHSWYHQWLLLAWRLYPPSCKCFARFRARNKAYTNFHTHLSAILSEATVFCVTGGHRG